MSFKNSVKPILMTSLNANLLGIPYVCINPLGLPKQCIRVRILNNSSVPITLSWDGAMANDYLTPETPLDLVFETTDSTGMYTPSIKKGQKFWASSTGAGIGFIHVTGYYLESL